MMCSETYNIRNTLFRRFNALTNPFIHCRIGPSKTAVSRMPTSPHCPRYANRVSGRAPANAAKARNAAPPGCRCDIQYRRRQLAGFDHRLPTALEAPNLSSQSLQSGAGTVGQLADRLGRSTCITIVISQKTTPHEPSVPHHSDAAAAGET